MSERPKNSAHSCRVIVCDECEYPHLILCDEEGNGFAQAVINQGIIDLLQFTLLRLRQRADKAQ